MADRWLDYYRIGAEQGRCPTPCLHIGPIRGFCEHAASRYRGPWPHRKQQRPVARSTVIHAWRSSRHVVVRQHGVRILVAVGFLLAIAATKNALAALARDWHNNIGTFDTTGPTATSNAQTGGVNFWADYSLNPGDCGQYGRSSLAAATGRFFGCRSAAFQIGLSSIPGKGSRWAPPPSAIVRLGTISPARAKRA